MADIRDMNLADILIDGSTDINAIRQELNKGTDSFVSIVKVDYL